MSGFCGLYARTGACDQALLLRMCVSLKHRGEGSGTWVEETHGRIGLVQSEWRERTSPTLPYPFHAGACRIVADARLDNREELQKRFAGHLQEPGATDTMLIAAAYSRWGEHCVEHLLGDFAFLIWDGHQQSLFGARSPMGVRPFVYHLSHERILFASEAGQLLEDASISKELDPTWMAMWLVEGVNHWGTIYRDIHELLPGHMIRVASDVSIAPFWEPSPRALVGFRRQEEATEQFHELLTEAVQCRLPMEQPFLCDISGGLDSSSLACLAGELGQQAAIHGIHAYSEKHVEKDDRGLAGLIAEKYGFHMEYLSYEDFPAFDDICLPQRWLDTPTIPTVFLSKLYHRIWTIAHEQGIRSHLRGDFGDQLFSTTHYLSTYVHEHNPALVGELLRWRKAHTLPVSQLLSQNMVTPWLRQRKQTVSVTPARSWVRAQVWEDYAQQQARDQSYFRKACPDARSRELFRWMRLHSEYVIMHSAVIAHGVEMIEPFTDLRLIEFMLSCPAHYQVRSEQKFLLREAMKGIVPEPVRVRKSKGRMARLLFQGIARNQEVLRELVLTSPDLILPYLDTRHLASMLSYAAQGGALNQPQFFSALALVLWAHRLPWGGGKLPREE